MFKLGYCKADEWIEHSHPPIYSLEMTTAGEEKLIATVPGSDPIVFQKLAHCLTPPFFVLYVLHTPRGEGEPGRYQSAEITRDDLDRFIRRYELFLRSDSRFDLWLHSPADQATIVWDRHNLAFGYGPTRSLIAALRGLGFERGQPTIPAPHQHHYHQAFDDDARAVLTDMAWSYSPLQPEDLQ